MELIPRDTFLGIKMSLKILLNQKKTFKNCCLSITGLVGENLQETVMILIQFYMKSLFLYGTFKVYLSDTDF